jgi:hypothetical protein
VTSRTILVWLLVAGKLAAQRWEYHHDAPAPATDDFFWACAVEPDGSGYYGGGDKNIPEESRFIVAALSSAGVERWVDEDALGVVEDICIGEDGFIYAAGTILDPDSTRRFTVVCYDRWGARRWMYKATAPDRRAGVANVVQSRPGSGVYVGGWIDVTGSYWQFAVAALDSSGNQRWLDTLGGTGLGGEYVEDLCVGADGNVYACGYLTDTLFPVGAVVSFTPAGAVRWSSFDSLFYPYGICVGADGNVYVSGASGPQHLPDIAAASFTSTGTPRWTYSYDPGGRGSLDLDHANDIVWGDGNVYIGGQGCRNDDSIDAFIFSLDPQGGERWQYWFRGDYGWFNWVNELVFTPDNYIHGAGLTNSLISEAAEWCLTADGDEMWVFERHSEGPNSAGAWCIASDSAGNVYFGGDRYTDARVAWAASLSRPQTAVGGDQTDHAYAVAALPDSGFIVAAETRSFGAGSSDGWVLRLNPHGDTLWTRTAGGSETDVLWDVTVARDGGFVLSGELNNDPVLYKFDGTGTEVWSVGYSVPNFGRMLAVHNDAGNGFVLAGGRYNGANYMYGLIIGADSVGNEQWRTELGTGSNYAYLDDIAACPGGGYLLTGQWRGTSSANGDLWLVRIDAGGDTLWTRTFGGSGNDWGAAIVPASGGGYAIVGTMRSFGPGSYNIWLLRVNESGDTLWTRTWGIDGEVIWGKGIVEVPGQGFAVTGDFDNQTADLLLLETDYEGNELARQYFGGVSNEHGEDICLGTGGGYCLVGSTLSFGTAGSEDVYIVTTAFGVGMAEPRPPDVPPVQIQARLASTVVRGVLFLEARGEKREARVELLDVSGRRVLNLKPGANDVGRLSPGVYFVRDLSAVSSETSAVSVRKVIVTE